MMAKGETVGGPLTPLGFLPDATVVAVRAHSGMADLSLGDMGPK
jgi:hypothetical protein